MRVAGGTGIFGGMNAVVMRDELAPEESEFVKLVVKFGKPPGDAAIEAGFGTRVTGWQLLRRPRIAAAIHTELQRALQTELAPLSFNVLRKLIESEQTPARTRADIGRHLLQMAGYGQEKTRSDESKPLSEMSATELAAVLERNQKEIDRLESELASRAKDVSASIAQQPAAKPLNFLD